MIENTGITLRTALIIQNNPLVKCSAGGPAKNGKYVGWIMLDVDKWHPLLNSEPVFSSEKEAIETMQAVVDSIRATDLIGKEEDN